MRDEFEITFFIEGKKYRFYSFTDGRNLSYTQIIGPPTTQLPNSKYNYNTIGDKYWFINTQLKFDYDNPQKTIDRFNKLLLIS